MRIEINGSKCGSIITLISAVDIGQDQLIDPMVPDITDRTGVHIFEFVTDDAGSSIAVIDCPRNNRAIEVRTVWWTDRCLAGERHGKIYMFVQVRMTVLQ